MVLIVSCTYAEAFGLCEHCQNMIVFLCVLSLGVALPIKWD